MSNATNYRLRDLAPGVVGERIATSTHIDYFPVSGDMDITFGAPEFLTLDGELQSLVGPTEFLRTTLASIATEKFASDEVDPVTGADLSQVSVAGVALIIKRAYNALYNRQKAAEAQLLQPAP